MTDAQSVPARPRPGIPLLRTVRAAHRCEFPAQGPFLLREPVRLRWTPSVVLLFGQMPLIIGHLAQRRYPRFLCTRILTAPSYAQVKYPGEASRRGPGHAGLLAQAETQRLEGRRRDDQRADFTRSELGHPERSEECRPVLCGQTGFRGFWVSARD
jgi:hypothetical protein